MAADYYLYTRQVPVFEKITVQVMEAAGQTKKKEDAVSQMKGLKFYGIALHRN